MTDAEKYAVINGWLVQNVDHHTCGAGTAETGYLHEPGCGREPIARVEQLLAQPQSIDREDIRKAVQPVLWNTSNYPRAAQPHILGQDITPLTSRVVDAVMTRLEEAR